MTKTLSKKQFVFLTAFALLACSKANHNNSAATQADAVTINEKYVGSSCSVTKIDGSLLDGGAEGLTVGLDVAMFGKSETAIYIVGNFPADASVELQDASHTAPSEADLIKKGAPWEWTIAPKQDANGQWTKLTMYREVFDESADGSYHYDSKGVKQQTAGGSYRYDEREVSYGQKFKITDALGGVNVACKMPKTAAAE